MITTLVLIGAATVAGAWKLAEGLYTVLQPHRCGWCGDPVAKHPEQRPC